MPPIMANDGRGAVGSRALALGRGGRFTKRPYGYRRQPEMTTARSATRINGVTATIHGAGLQYHAAGPCNDTTADGRSL